MRSQAHESVVQISSDCEKTSHPPPDATQVDGTVFSKAIPKLTGVEVDVAAVEVVVGVACRLSHECVPSSGGALDRAIEAEAIEHAVSAASSTISIGVCIMNKKR